MWKPKEKAGKPASPSTARSTEKDISINAHLNRAHLETPFFPFPSTREDEKGVTVIGTGRDFHSSLPSLRLFG
jgi:hypothetical protein